MLTRCRIPSDFALVLRRPVQSKTQSSLPRIRRVVASKNQGERACQAKSCQPSDPKRSFPSRKVVERAPSRSGKSCALSSAGRGTPSSSTASPPVSHGAASNPNWRASSSRPPAEVRLLPIKGGLFHQLRVCPTPAISCSVRRDQPNKTAHAKRRRPHQQRACRVGPERR